MQFLKRNNQNIKIFYSNYVIKNIETLKGKKFLAFSGIADNQSFFITLKENDVEVLSTKEFSDHHKFTEQEISKLINEAKIKNIELIKYFFEFLFVIFFFLIFKIIRLKLSSKLSCFLFKKIGPLIRKKK